MVRSSFLGVDYKENREGGCQVRREEVEESNIRANSFFAFLQTISRLDCRKYNQVMPLPKFQYSQLPEACL